MNLILLSRDQFFSPACARLNDRQKQHVETILKGKDRKKLQVGVINENIGSGVIVNTKNHIEIHDIALNTPPPPQLPITLLLGLPRPQMIKRILQTVACLGVEELILFQSSRVEKSFWQSPSVRDDAIYEHLLLGLEQGVATQLPNVKKFTRFRPFLEDSLPEIIKKKDTLIAHPGTKLQPTLRSSEHKNLVLAVGPEGGFIEKEVNAFCDAGFEAITLGDRILKVETAIPVLLAKLFSF